MYLKAAPLHFNELLLSEEKNESNSKDGHSTDSRT